MKTKAILLSFAMSFIGAIALVAQQQPKDMARTPGVQAGADPNRAAFVMANCKNPAPPPPARGGGAPGAPGAPGRGAGAAPPPAAAEYTVAAIPNIIDAGQRWRVLWEDTGNNADSPIGVADGVLLAQNSKSQVIKVGLNGKVELVATDTYTGGALAMTKDGKLYVGERALNRSIWQIQPKRALFADKKDGEPLECLGQAVLNDMIADSKGGIYMTMGGVYYVNPQGVTMGRFGVTGGNGIILSKDDKTLYVTGRLMGAMPPADLKIPAGAPMPTGGLVAFDVQPDGSLTNERQFTWAGGDGTAIDDAGRIYTTGNDGVWVVGARGELLGFIPAPRNLISVAFGGPNKRTLFGVSIRDVQIFAIDTIARGIQTRPK
jgi:sugar lactone lactonase YvrE